MGFIFQLFALLPGGQAHVIHSTAYEDKRDEMRLPNSVLSTSKAATAAKCGLACNKNEDCRSFNFCDGKVCELNREDVFSTADGVDILQQNKTCKYFGMKKQSIPVCQKDGVLAQIRRRSSIEQCRIHKKRVDRQLGTSQSIVEIYKRREWRKVWRSEVLVDAAHGGKELEIDTPVERLRLERDKKSWSEAKENCEMLGGKLFSDLNGTEAQLQFLLDKMGGERHWVGISSEDHESWNTTDGETVDGDHLLWNNGEPNGKGSENCVIVGFHGATLNDFKCAREEASVCNMI